MLQAFLDIIKSLFKRPVGMPLEAPVMPQDTISTHGTMAEPLETRPVVYVIDPKWGLSPELLPIAERFFLACSDKGYNLKITQGLRTREQQARLYAQGRTSPGVVVTHAKPGTSYHETGKAFDVCFEGLVPYPSDDAHWKAIADIGVSCGLTAGYYFHAFKDRPHFQT